MNGGDVPTAALVALGAGAVCGQVGVVRLVLGDNPWAAFGLALAACGVALAVLARGVRGRR